MIGFLTGISNVVPGTTMGVIYLPTAPTPNSGWVAMVPIQNIFKRVVVVEYPKQGTWMIGFLTGISNVVPGTTMGVIYLPTAPTPNSGWVAMVPIQNIYDTTMTVREAMSMVAGYPRRCRLISNRWIPWRWPSLQPLVRRGRCPRSAPSPECSSCLSWATATTKTKRGEVIWELTPTKFG